MIFRFRDFLASIRSRVGAFSLMATLLPSVTLGWLSYERNATVLQQKAEQEIVAASQFAVREMDLWLKDRIYELRVIGSSHLVTENLERYLTPGAIGADKSQRPAVMRGIQEYLRSVGKRFTAYSALQVTTPEGDLLGSAGVPVQMPEGWPKKLKQNQVLISDPYWDESVKAVSVVVAIPIRSVRGRPLGSLIAVMNTQAVRNILMRFPVGSGEIFVVNSEGRRIMSSLFPEGVGQFEVIPTFAALGAASGKPGEYRNYHGKSVVGTLLMVPESQWGVIVERESDDVFEQVYALRNTTILVVAALLSAVGIGAYGIGLTLVYPLDRLVRAADQVASGNLDVTVPVARRDELGHLTESFNEMTSQLRKNREALAAANDALVRKNIELEAISITDSLTGLHNRRFLMDVLTREFQQHARSGQTFTVLMADLDHFKRVNDTHGHPAGDAVLVNSARIFRESIRSGDYAARFGGEEFVLLLIGSSLNDARVTAERIRERVASSAIDFEGKSILVTLSIGLAEVSAGAEETIAALISRADAALYRAKHEGRNMVCCDGEAHQTTPSSMPV